MSMSTIRGRITTGHLVLVLVLLVVAVATASIVYGARRAHPDAAPITSSTQTTDTMDRMVLVFEELLGGIGVDSPAHLSSKLSALRPAALTHRAWPEADYALLGSESSDDPEGQALGAAVWTSSSLSQLDVPGSWAAHCMLLQIDRHEARIRWHEVECPQGVPEKPPAAATRQAQASSLEQPVLPTRAAFFSPQDPDSDPIRRGSWTIGRVPSARPPSMGVCDAESLDAVLDSGNGAGNTDDLLLRVQNISSDTCTLPVLSELKIERRGELVEPMLTQGGHPLDLAPWESAVTTISFHPHQISPRGDIITVTINGADAVVADPEDLIIRVLDGDEIRAAPWQQVGYGVLRGTDENGRGEPDIAPLCTPEQLAVTARAPETSSSGNEAELPDPTPFTVMNISTSGCRLDAGTFAGITAVPPLTVPSTALLQTGHSLDLFGPSSAPDLTGLLIVDGVTHPVTSPPNCMSQRRDAL